MNTTAAALQANVTVATIRTWCRYGAVTAVKQAGRWIIDSASLATRIALGALKRPARKVEFTSETMTAIGGNRWQKNGKDRVYINDWAEFAGIETNRYGTGNISSAFYQGERISNRQAGLLLGSISKVWFDAADGKVHCRYGWSESRVADREEVWEAVVEGIRTAISAL
ncbi:hypothetical protein [Streptomyces axinellae]|uniref:Helix-turn-helix domain-containing protein n=1 Tax=Streptomyces axinellae TaxID=552788 RepID=A0ABN3R0W3_9ACTN